MSGRRAAPVLLSVIGYRATGPGRPVSRASARRMPADAVDGERHARAGGPCRPAACRRGASGAEADAVTMDIGRILRSGRPCSGRPPTAVPGAPGHPARCGCLDLGSMAGLLARGSSFVRAFPVSQWHAVARIHRSQLRGQPQIRGMASPAFPFDPVSGHHQRARVMACAPPRQISGDAGMRKNVIAGQDLSKSFLSGVGAAFHV